jgi:hypothetical protein
MAKWLPLSEALRVTGVSEDQLRAALKCEQVRGRVINPDGTPTELREGRQWLELRDPHYEEIYEREAEKRRLHVLTWNGSNAERDEAERLLGHYRRLTPGTSRFHREGDKIEYDVVVVGKPPPAIEQDALRQLWLVADMAELATVAKEIGDGGLALAMRECVDGAWREDGCMKVGDKRLPVEIEYESLLEEFPSATRRGSGRKAGGHSRGPEIIKRFLAMVQQGSISLDRSMQDAARKVRAEFPDYSEKYIAELITPEYRQLKTKKART